MRKGLTVLAMAIVSLGAPSCIELKQPQEQVQTEEFKWVVDTFDDIKVLQYKVPGFENLSLDQKKLIYYLNQAALSGRDIIFDQNFKYNLPIRRTLEAIYTNYRGDRTTAEWKAFEKYLKKVWFANGIHHHYSSDKFTPEFSEAYFDTLVASVPAEKLPHDFGSAEQLMAIIKPVIFDPALYPVRVNQAAGADLLKSSAMNYYDGVSQREAEAFYARMAKPGDPQPISYGLNSQLVKQNGKLTERVWKTDGMYAPALEKIVYWLEKAAEVVSPVQKETIEALISFYNTGDLKEYDRFNILWVQDTASMVDFVNGFTEVYGDPLGYKASWEAMVNFKDMDATRRTEIISANAQWFEDHSPIQEKYRKKEVKGVSAKVINAAILGGDCYPATPIGINLPNADWIRKDYGSKSVTIQNITQAYAESSKGNGFIEEFIFRPEDRERITLYGTIGDNMHTDLHECLGHGSGQLAPGVKGDELKQYGSVLEEARADLFSLYYMADPKMEELGLLPDAEVAKAQYASYISTGMMTQLARVELGKDIEQTQPQNDKRMGLRTGAQGECHREGSQRREDLYRRQRLRQAAYPLRKDAPRSAAHQVGGRFRGGTRPGGTVRRQGGPQTARRGARTLRQTRYPALQRLREPDIHSCHGGRRNRGHHLRVPEKLHGTDAGLLVKVLFPPFGELTRGTFFRMPAYPGRYSRVLTETTLVASAGD